MEFVYPYGCTLNVQEPAVNLLSSGNMSYPTNKVLMSCCESGGRIVLVGSIDMFTDEYFDKEDNGKIFEVILKYLLRESEGFGESV